MPVNSCLKLVSRHLVYTQDNKSKVCEIVAVDPSLDENTTNLNSDARRLTVSGKGFDATNTSANTFNFTQTTGDKVKRSDCSKSTFR